MRTRANKWTEEHVAILREHYPMRGAAFVAALVGRTDKMVASKAYSIGVKNVQAWRNGTPYVRKPKSAQPSFSIAAPSRGPAYLPGDVETLPRSPNFRHTIYPSKPAPLRTNTHTNWG